MVKAMTASEYAKFHGLKSLSQVASMIGVTTQCLRNWHKLHPKRFEIVLLGCVSFLQNEPD